MFPWVLAEFHQREWEMVRQYMAEKFDGQAAKQQLVQGRGKCRTEGCRMLANEAGYCPTHYRQSMAAAVREASARREGSR